MASAVDCDCGGPAARSCGAGLVGPGRTRSCGGPGVQADGNRVEAPFPQAYEPVAPALVTGMLVPLEGNFGLARARVLIATCSSRSSPSVSGQSRQGLVSWCLAFMAHAVALASGRCQRNWRCGCVGPQRGS